MATAVTVGDHFASVTVIINLKYASIMLMGKVYFTHDINMYLIVKIRI